MRRLRRGLAACNGYEKVDSRAYRAVARAMVSSPVTIVAVCRRPAMDRKQQC